EVGGSGGERVHVGPGDGIEPGRTGGGDGRLTEALLADLDGLEGPDAPDASDAPHRPDAPGAPLGPDGPDAPGTPEPR
ncbi:hypothetical protein AMK15_31710, partial [Streptomyces sp. MJM1172]